MKTTLVALAVHEACMRIAVAYLVRKIEAEERERQA